MRIPLTILLACVAFCFLSAATHAQPAKGKAPDDPDRPRLEPPSLDPAPRPRREPRPDDEPPPPGKAGPRPKAGDSPYPQSFPMPVPPGVPGMPGSYGAAGGGFGGGGMRPGGSAQGFGGGFGGYGAGPNFMRGPGERFYGEAPPDDPEMRELMKQDTELEQQSHAMTQRLREASGEERQRLKDSLADVVTKHFDVRQKRRELQIKRMEEELARLRETIAKRNDSRKSIIENRFRELIGEPRDLDF